MEVTNIYRRPIWIGNTRLKPGQTENINCSKKFANYLGLKIDSNKSESKDKSTTTDLKRLIAIGGVEDEIAQMLLDIFGSLEGVRNANEKQLEDLPAIGKYRAKKILKSLRGEN